MNWKPLSIAALWVLNATVQAELLPLKVPILDPVTNKYTGSSVIADSIDNQSSGDDPGAGLQFRDRIYNYDLALDSSGKAYVLYADPKPAQLDSPLPVDVDKEKSDIVLAVETPAGWNKTILSSEGHYQNTAIRLAMDGNNVLHMTYIRKTTKETHDGSVAVDYLIYRMLENGVLSEEKEVGDFAAGNFCGLGSWRTLMALDPNGQVYMLREGASDDLKTPYLRLLVPDGEGNWTETRLSGLPTPNWFLLGNFQIDAAGGAHVTYGDYGYDENGQVYSATNGWRGVQYNGYHRLRYAHSATLDGQGWSSLVLDEDPADPVPNLKSDQFWVDLAIDENNKPAVAKWRWKVGTEFPGYNTDSFFFHQTDGGTWTTARTTRTFDDLAYKKQGHLAGMGPGIAKTRHGWHGAWDSSHPRPFEHEYARGGIMYRFSPDGLNWNNYQPLAPFSGEGRSIVKIDNQGRLNVLVLGDHTDTQLYLLRYRLPGDNLMEVYTDRRYYYQGETIAIHAEVRGGAVGDFYAAVVSTARPEINQSSQIWQLTKQLTWQKIANFAELTPAYTATQGFTLSMPLMIMSAQEPTPDTNYTMYSAVAKPGTNVLDAQNWVTPVMIRQFTANITIPQQ